MAGPGAALLMAALGMVPHSRGQELRVQRHPLSTYLDLRPAVAGATPQTAPRWVESFDFISATKPGVEPSLEMRASANNGVDNSQSIFRIRLQHPAAASDHLQMRVFFEDRETGARPTVAVWNELGERMMPPTTLGQGLGLPSSETLTVFMNGVNYLEIQAPGDGSQVRGVFLSWLETTQVLQPSDFPDQDRVHQPFGVLPRARTHGDDRSLYGAVTARLQGSKPLVLKDGAAPSAAFEFELEHAPMMAVVTFEVLGAAIDAPPGVTVNDHPLGTADLYLPDLADPAFRAETREAEAQVNFRYTGWVRAQKVIPAASLSAGLNNLSVKLSNTTDSVAIRSVSIQLKYPWDKLDTVLVPAPTPYETR